MRTKSIATMMLEKKGIAFSKLYLERIPGIEILACEHGHPDCGQIKGGACSAELKHLIKNFTPPKPMAPFKIEPFSLAEAA